MENPTLPPPRLDMYAQDLLRQSYQTNPISTDVLSQYGQGMDQQVIQPPVINNYAPQQQFQQAPQRTLQPSEKRMEYNALVEQRFNEIADMVGGMEVLYKTGRIDKAKKAALEDIQNIYGEPPAIEQPMSEKERVELEQARFNLNKAMNPQMTELDRVKLEQEKLALEQAQKTIGKAETERMRAESDKLKSAQENIGLASDVVSSVDRLLADENALEWAGGKSGALFGSIPGSQTKGIRQQIDQLRDQIGLFGRKAIVGQGQGSISDAEQKMAKEALSQVITEGTDEQLIQSLKAVRQKFGGILDRIQAEASNAQPAGQPMAQPAGQPAAKPIIKMDINPANGRYERVK